MARVLMKWGGGLITEKGALRTPRRDVIDQLAHMVARLKRSGNESLIVHGAGSYGHLIARRWNLHLGRDDDLEAEPYDGIRTQHEAVDQVRRDVLALNLEVIGALEAHGLRGRTYPPSMWARGTGPSFEGTLPFLGSPQDIPVTFGDVVHTDPPQEFGILSGDDLMVRMANELDGIDHVVFLLEVDGVFDRDPVDPGATLLQQWTPEVDVARTHHLEIDVTGGIGKKLDSARLIARGGREVWFLNGHHPERLEQLVQGNVPIGTRIWA